MKWSSRGPGVRLVEERSQRAGTMLMGLTGALSNPEVTARLQYLTARDCHKDPYARRPVPGWSDGRRRFGTVSAAIAQVLSEADGELRVKDIQAAVEQLSEQPGLPLLSQGLST